MKSVMKKINMSNVGLRLKKKKDEIIKKARHVIINSMMRLFINFPSSLYLIVWLGILFLFVCILLICLML